MLKLLKYEQIDKQKWDDCVMQSRELIVYGLSWYLDVVAEEWQAIVDEQNGQYVSVMPLPLRRKLGITYVQQPLQCQQLGIFCRMPQPDVAYVEQFLALAKRYFRYILNYAFNTGNAQVLEKLAQKHHLQLHYTHHLPLDKPYEEIYKGYNRDRKNNLKKGKKTDSVIVESHDVEPLLRLFREDIAPKIYGGVAESAYDLLRRLTQKLQEKNAVRLLYTKPEAGGEEEAGVMIAIHDNKLIYIFNAANQQGRVRNGRMLLLDHLLKSYANSNYIFDFESADVPQIAYFYHSFGSTPTPYYSLTYNNLPWPIKQTRELRMRLYRKFFVKDS